MTLLCTRCWEQQHGRAARWRRVSTAGVTQPCCSGRPHCAEIPTPLAPRLALRDMDALCIKGWSKMRPYRHTAPVRGEGQADLKTPATAWAPENAGPTRIARGRTSALAAARTYPSGRPLVPRYARPMPLKTYRNEFQEWAIRHSWWVDSRPLVLWRTATLLRPCMPAGARDAPPSYSGLRGPAGLCRVEPL